MPKKSLYLLGCHPTNPCLTPIDTKLKVSVTDCTPYEDPLLYHSLSSVIQSLTFTRPYISYELQQICFFMHNPVQAHMHALRCILRYIQGTRHYSLHLYPSSITFLMSYISDDLGGCLETRHSTSGYYVLLGDNLLS